MLWRPDLTDTGPCGHNEPTVLHTHTQRQKLAEPQTKKKTPNLVQQSHVHIYGILHTCLNGHEKY